VALLRAFICSTQGGRGRKKRAEIGDYEIGGGNIEEVVTAGEKGTGRRGWEISIPRFLVFCSYGKSILFMACIFNFSATLFEIAFASTLEISSKARVCLLIKCPLFLPDIISNFISTRCSRIFQY
jgi:hypothetical protein